MVARLPWSGRPDELARVGVQCGPLGQPGRAVHQHRVQVGVSRLDEEAEFAAQLYGVKRRVEYRGAVGVVDADLDGHRVGQAAGIDDREGDLIIAGLFVARRPLEGAVQRVERDARRQIFDFVDQGVAIGVTGLQLDGERYAFRNEQRFAGHDLRSAVDVFNRDGERVQPRAVSVADDDLNVVVDA